MEFWNGFCADATLQNEIPAHLEVREYFKFGFVAAKFHFVDPLILTDGRPRR